MVKVADIYRLGEINRVAGAFHVNGNLAGFIGTQVIHRSQMVKMVYLPFERFDSISRNAELFRGQIPKHRKGTRRACTPVLTQGGHFAFALLADQKVNDRAFALKQLFDQPFANKTGCASDEILHK